MSMSKTDCLIEANRIRGLRSRFRSELKAMEADQARFVVAEAIVSIPDWLAAADTHWVLCLAPEVGDSAARRLLAAVDVRLQRPLRTISLRQRMALAEAVRSISHSPRVAVSYAA